MVAKGFCGGITAEFAEKDCIVPFAWIFQIKPLENGKEAISEILDPVMPRAGNAYE